MTERRCLQHSPQLMMQEDAEIKGSRSFWCMSRSHMWKCEDVNLPVRWPFSPVFSCWLDCLFASEKRFCSDLNKKCLDQSCFILKCCYFIALWKHPVLAIKTRCWNVTLLSVEVGISRIQSSICTVNAFLQETQWETEHDRIKTLSYITFKTLWLVNIYFSL